MLRVTVELVPSHGGQPKPVGVAWITNDESGTPELGNYDVVLLRDGPRRHQLTGRVEVFPRLQLGAWDLVYQALAATVGARHEGNT